MPRNCLNYPVEITEDAFGENETLAEMLKTVGGSAVNVLLVADMNVVQHTTDLGTKIGHYVKAHGIRLAGSPVVIGGGEKCKADGLQSALRIASAILDARLGKNDVVLVLGGGTLLDVVGYAAVQVRGGVKIVRMPTTPAAMIDAAYATYAAVNLSSVKDALRVPSEPAGVLIDPSFAATVLDGVWSGGFGAAMRLAVAHDAAMTKKLSACAEAYKGRGMEVLKDIIQAVCALYRKKGDTTLSRWSALRLESMSAYKLPHGYATAIGLLVDLVYAREAGIAKAADVAFVRSALETSGALDGLAHSQHLLSQTDNLLRGLDAWRLSSGAEDIELPSKLGATKSMIPDRELYKKVLQEMLFAPKDA